MSICTGLFAGTDSSFVSLSALRTPAGQVSMRARNAVALFAAFFLGVPAVAGATPNVVPAKPGINLKWNNCFLDGAVTNRNFACAANTGNNVMIGTFAVPVDLPVPRRTDFVLDLATASATLPAWWQFKNAGSCRMTSMLISSVVPAVAVNCIDWTQGNGMPGITDYQVGARGPNTARVIAFVQAFDPVTPPIEPLVADVEYYAFTLSFNNAKTVGTGACAGCSTPACIVLNSVRISSADGSTLATLTAPSTGTDSNLVTWQGGAGVGVGSVIGCPAATAARGSTWGRIKAIYR